MTSKMSLIMTFDDEDDEYEERLIASAGMGSRFGTPTSECEWAFFLTLRVEMFVYENKESVVRRKDLKKDRCVEGIVEKVKFPNKGIVKVEDSEVTVKILFRDRKFPFVINKKRKRKSRGRLLEILKKSRTGECRG